MHIYFVLILFLLFIFIYIMCEPALDLVPPSSATIAPRGSN